MKLSLPILSIELVSIINMEKALAAVALGYGAYKLINYILDNANNGSRIDWETRRDMSFKSYLISIHPGMCMIQTT